MFIHDSAAGRRRSASVPLVWLLGRRRASDPAHATARVLEGLRTGAAVGIDILPMSDGHFAIIAGARLEDGTNGSGPVVRARAADLARLRHRTEDGSRGAEAPTTLAALVEAIGPGMRGRLHVHLIRGDEVLRPGHEAGFARALRPLADRVHLWGRDVTALRRLGDAVPGLSLGLALADHTAEWLLRTGDAAAFAAQVADAMPEAGYVHLSGHTILALDDEDIGLVAAFKARGWQVEAHLDGNPGSGPADLWDVLRLVALGVDRIATGDPQGRRAALDWRHPPAGRQRRLSPLDDRLRPPVWQPAA